MYSVAEVLARCWPLELRTDPLVLRPVQERDAGVLGVLLTDPQVGRFLGGPAGDERVARGLREYPVTPGCWAIEPAGEDGAAVGLVTIGADHRCEGRAEVSYQLLPAQWGKGLGKEAVGAAVAWWGTVAGAGSLVAVTQRANTGSRRLLEGLGWVLLDDGLEEYGALQCLYTPVGTEDDVLRWARLYDGRREEAERRIGALVRATEPGAVLPGDLEVLGVEAMIRRCPARHGAHGRVCAYDSGHRPALHLGRARDGGWIAWRGDADH
ncbi:GNAT family N-acetyltransferase [Streptacidiphilus sp. EB103A]|uniref:GNAT family N-acetyltransferase n=1 Tax=Streptacidiphilus sp. EB103A TaxID=3156275 RepID=UPI0035180F03